MGNFYVCRDCGSTDVGEVREELVIRSVLAWDEKGKPEVYGPPDNYRPDLNVFVEWLCSDCGSGETPIPLEEWEGF